MSEESNELGYMKQIFFSALMVTRKWDVLVNRAYSKEEVTLKQLLLLIILDAVFTYDPTIKEVATVLTTSHQNTKALALQLEKKGFVTLYKDSKDLRAWRIKTCDTKKSYWDDRDKKDTAIIMELFKDIPLDSLEKTAEIMEALNTKASNMLNFK